jgi:hypothetical protein
VDSYAMRAWVDWARHTVMAEDDEPADEDYFASARGKLQEWRRQMVRDGTMTAQDYFKSL